MSSEYSDEEALFNDAVLQAIIHSVGPKRLEEVALTLVHTIQEASKGEGSFNVKVNDLLPDLTLAELLTFVDFVISIEKGDML